MKLLDYEERRGELERSANPFALVVLAHLDAQKTRKLPDERSKLEAKLGILRRLYDRQLGSDNIRDLVRFIDWLVRLPKGLEEELQERLREDRKAEAIMPFLSNIERFAMERGQKEGLEKGLEQGRQQGKQEGLREGQRQGQEKGLREAIGLLLETRFGPAGIALQPRLLEVQELDRLRTLLAALGRAERIEEFAAHLGKS